MEESKVIIEQLYSTISPRLAAVATTATVRTAARALSQLNVGMLVVCNEGGPVVGVISKSDLVRHLAREGDLGAALTSVMTRNVVACSIRDELQAVWKKMVDRRLQNVPVLNDHARPVGVLDIRDALSVLLQEEENEEKLLVNYVSGIGYR
jgi:CBS domain-containing protein